MEKGFNDDELADIMNEIESLEKEFSADMADKSQSHDQTETIESKDSEGGKADFEEEFKAKEDEQVPGPHAGKHHEEDHHEEAHQVLDELSKMDIEEATPASIKHDGPSHHHTIEESNVTHLKEVHNQHPKSEHKESAHTSMSFHVEGDMKFDLSFHIGGQYVGLTVTEQGLEIGLEGGAKFTVPVREVSSIKKAS